MLPLLSSLLLSPSSASEPDPMLGQEVYERSCAACHGPRGEGASALRAINVKPRNLAGTWVERVDDTYLEGVIRDGGMSVGRSPLMPAWGRVMSDDEIRSVAAYVRLLSAESDAPAAAVADDE
jgi:cytochrome c oxidase cbb3-type subunit 3